MMSSPKTCRQKQTSVVKRQSDIPMYVQIADVLRKELTRRETGSRVPGDHALCARFKVSQPVVRAALDLLVKEHRLRRIAGKGTFVTRSAEHPTSRKPCLIAAAPLGSFFPHSGALQGIQQVAAEHGYDLLLHPNPTVLFDSTAFVSAVSDWLEQAEGIIWVNPHTEEYPAILPAPRPSNSRLVLVNLTFVTEDGYTSVMADYQTAARNLTSHLIEQGRRRIGYIGGPRERLFARLRWEGYQKAMQSHGLEIEQQLVCPFAEDAINKEQLLAAAVTLGQEAEQDYRRAMRDTGYAGMRRILKARQRPDAVFAVTDSTALGAFTALQKAGLRVPDDVTLAGFDDSPLAQHMTPGLTTARPPYLEIGRLATRLLFDQLKKAHAPGGRHFIPCPLVIRDSSGKHPSAAGKNLNIRKDAVAL